MLLVATTFPLIWIGGLVTTYKAGMAVPDWPSTYGYNLFLYPWQTWINGPWDLFIEHGHRLWGASVGLVTIGLVISVWRQDARRWMRACALVALAAVIFQGLLGGLRVNLDQILLARIHGCFGPAFFAFATALAVFTSRSWREAGAASAAGPAACKPVSGALDALGANHGPGRLYPTCAGLALAACSLRHGAGSFSRRSVAHGLTAVALAALVIVLAVWTSRYSTAGGMLLRPASALVALVAAQLALGVGTWILKYGWPIWLGSILPAYRDALADFTVTAGGRLQAWVTTLHVAIGSLILATAVMTAVRVTRMKYASTESAERGSRSGREVATQPRLLEAVV